MPANSWDTKENDIVVAADGLRIQAKAHGLDLTDPNVISFIEHESKVLGALYAQTRWLQSLLSASL